MENIKLLPQNKLTHPQYWRGPQTSLVFEEESIRSILLHINSPFLLVQTNEQVGATTEGVITDTIQNGVEGFTLVSILPKLGLDQLGDSSFMDAYGLRYPYMTGAMANGISSEELVCAVGKAGMLGSFGAAGLSISRIEAAIHRIQSELPQGPYAFNVIHNHHEPELERKVVDLFLQNRIDIVEASAFLGLTANIVHYRAAGLSLDPSGEIQSKNKIIAKLSRREVATKFMEPAPQKLLQQLVEENRITPLQASLAEKIPVADDITVEADSGGHTDNRPLVNLLPSIIALRDEIQSKYKYDQLIRIGAAGGISTPASALAAFMMGAAYITTGSINQACLEAGTSEHTRKLLSQASMTDITMAPAADMFEMGVKVQVLKSGTLFPMRASKLYDIYNRYNSIEDIPLEERDKLEKQIFKRSLDSVWQDTIHFFMERDPDQIEKANANPKRKMALIFRWYLGLSSRWSNSGEPGREMDYQVWCGPAMGAFNDWVRGSYLESPEQRSAVDIAMHLLTGAAYLYRVRSLSLQGVQLPHTLREYHPSEKLST